MQTILDTSTAIRPTISLAEAQRAASAYVATQIDPAFVVVDGVLHHHQSLDQEVWRFFVCCEHGPVGIVQIDARSGEAILLTADEIRLTREKAAIYAARKQGRLPLNDQGYVLGEYARRRADRYLGDHIAMFFNAADPVFVLGDPPRWQVTIVFQRYHRRPFTLGVMDVDAKTGEPIPLTKPQRKRISERAHALVQLQTQTAAA